MIRPKISTVPTAPRINIFSTTLNLDDVVESTTTAIGDNTISAPGWSCGVDVEATCVCEPKLYPVVRDCDVPDVPLIGTNWPGNLVQDPLNPSGFCRVESQVGCCLHRFNPVKVYETFVDPNNCMARVELESRASAQVRNFSNRVAADLMIGSTNGNPGLAVHAKELGGGNTIHPSVALGILHANFNQDGMVVVPWQSLSTLTNEGMIHPHFDESGLLAGYVDSWGYPVILDPGLTGIVGPPTGGQWNGTGPIDPSTDLQVETSGSGAAWMYITPPVWTAKSEPVSTVTRSDVSTDRHIQGNYEIGIADSKVIAVFSPCDIYAIKIEVNKAVSCG